MLSVDHHHLYNHLQLRFINTDLFGIYANLSLLNSKGNSSNSSPNTVHQNPLLLRKWYSTSSTTQTFLYCSRIQSSGEETQTWYFNLFPTIKYFSRCIFPMVFCYFPLGNKGHDPLQLWEVPSSRRILNRISTTCYSQNRGEETISWFEY